MQEQWEQLTGDPVALGIAIAIAVVAILVIALIIWLIVRRRRRKRFERRYGTEYQRTVDERGSRRQAERDLILRREHRDSLRLRSLNSSEREEVRGRFEAVQTSFVDAPEAALRSADLLIDEVAGRRGYEPANGSTRLDILAVDHPEDVAVHQRHLSLLTSDRRLETEDLRQALLAARRLFEQLVGAGEDDEAPAPEPPRTLLGLDEGEQQQRHRGDRYGDEGAERSEDGRSGDEDPRFVSEGPRSQTYSTRPSDDNRVGETIDVTDPDREPEAR